MTSHSSEIEQLLMRKIYFYLDDCHDSDPFQINHDETKRSLSQQLPYNTNGEGAGLERRARLLTSGANENLADLSSCEDRKTFWTDVEEQK
jgi:hypothetical protein